MSKITYLIDTNVVIGLEDHHTVQPVFAELVRVAAKHKVDILIHAAARDDIERDENRERCAISLSKLAKFQILKKVRGLTKDDLQSNFGQLHRTNDIVDATLLDALHRKAAGFLVTEDKKLHSRARNFSAELGDRVLFVADAVQFLKTTYEPVEAPVRYVEEVGVNEISLTDEMFNSLREDYPTFDNWWHNKCVRERRSC